VDEPYLTVNINISRPTKTKITQFKRCSWFLHAMRRLSPFWRNVFLSHRHFGETYFDATVITWKVVKRTMAVTIFLKVCPKFSPVSLKVYYLQFVSLSHFEKWPFGEKLLETYKSNSLWNKVRWSKTWTLGYV